MPEKIETIADVFKVKNLVSWLKLEKLRRKRENKLVFIGMHNVAQYYWCGLYAVKKSLEKENEHGFFQAYLKDRINKVGSKFLKQNLNSPEKILKKLSEVKKPKIAKRWSFSWNYYEILGIPDGFARDAVIEKKDISSGRFLTDNRPIAFAQGDLYGLFFKKSKKIIRIHSREDEKDYEWIEEIDKKRAIETLKKFDAVVKGNLPFPPKPYKCNNCDYKTDCVLYKNVQKKAAM